MSIPMMNAVWSSTRATGGDRLVLLAMADACNGRTGRCDPSITSLAEKCNMSERGVQKAIRRLVDHGELQVVAGGGRGRRNHYLITPNGVHPFEAQETASDEAENPEQGSPFEGPETPNNEPRTQFTLLPETPNDETQNPEQCDAKPRTPVRPNRKEPERNQDDARQARSILSEVVGENLAAEFARYRVRKKAPLAPTAAKLLCSRLAEIEKAHRMKPPDTLALVMERGWQSVQVDWIKPDMVRAASPKSEAWRKGLSPQEQAEVERIAAERRSQQG